MSGTFPSTILPISTVIRSVQGESSRIGEDEGRRQTILRGGQYWEIEALFPIMTRDKWDEFIAFVFTQGSDAFQIVLPPYDVPLGTITGSMLANGAASVGAESLNVDGHSGILADGSVFKFASHSKVYKATADRDGSGSLSFHPPLIESVADNEAITTTGVEFTARLIDDMQSLRAKAPDLAPLSVKMREAIS